MQIHYSLCFLSIFKGTVAWDFFLMILSKAPNRPPDSWSKAVSNKDSNSPRYSVFQVLPCYGPLEQIWLCTMGLWRIWLCAMGHCVEWSHTVKICDDFCSVCHSTAFGALWVTVQDFVIVLNIEEFQHVDVIFCLSRCHMCSNEGWRGLLGQGWKPERGYGRGGSQLTAWD